MDYYKESQTIAHVNEHNQILNAVEKWEAHKKGILHRGYTVVLHVGHMIILQHRKHPVFDNVYDLSFSSHQLYKKNILQDDIDAIYEGLKREWFVEKKDLVTTPVSLGTVYYQAMDEKSGYTEHEVDMIYSVTLRSIPKPNPEFAYGLHPVTKAQVVNHQLPHHLPLAPWVSKIIEKGLL